MGLIQPGGPDCWEHSPREAGRSGQMGVGIGQYSCRSSMRSLELLGQAIEEIYGNK